MEGHSSLKSREKPQLEEPQTDSKRARRTEEDYEEAHEEEEEEERGVVDNANNQNNNEDGNNEELSHSILANSGRNLLRLSQFERFLQTTNLSDSSFGLSSSIGGLAAHLGASDPFGGSWQDNLEPIDTPEQQQRMQQSAALQEQLLRTSYLLRRSQEGLSTTGHEGGPSAAAIKLEEGGYVGTSVSPYELFNRGHAAGNGSGTSGEDASALGYSVGGAGGPFPYELSESVTNLLDPASLASLTEYLKREKGDLGEPAVSIPVSTTSTSTSSASSSSSASTPSSSASTSTPKPNIRKTIRKGRKNQTIEERPPPTPLESAAAAEVSMALQAGQTAPGLIIQLNQLHLAIENQLKNMRYQQRRLLETLPPPEQLSQLLKTQGELMQKIDKASAQLKYINDTIILTTQEAHKLVLLLEALALDARILSLYQEELARFQCDPPNREPVAALVITKQPFPCTVKQSKSVDETVEVRLLMGAVVDLNDASEVKAELMNEEYHPAHNTNTKRKVANASFPSIQNGSERMDEAGVATFKRLTFPHGSRVKSVNMRFTADLVLNGQKVQLLSEPSKPFIVMTNHGQRSTTEGKLLKKHTFLGQSEIPWPAFANAMQLHYIRATKQEPDKPKRPLSPKDIEYLHLTKFAGKSSITQEDYDSFWAWFGTILYKIRNHQKHILPMWIQGLIYGFLSREDSDRLLQDQSAVPGSFLVRFSDRCVGQFVVVYVAHKDGSLGSVDSMSGGGGTSSSPTSSLEDMSTLTTTTTTSGGGGEQRVIKHYLVSPEEIEKKSTLPDFLRDCENLWYLLQVVRDEETGVVSLRPRRKDEIMAPYYSTARPQPLPLGYDNRQP
ncbi:Signal transducer and activator of transcription [Balamuthia mandrillaris]